MHSRALDRPSASCIDIALIQLRKSDRNFSMESGSLIIFERLSRGDSALTVLSNFSRSFLNIFYFWYLQDLTIEDAIGSLSVLKKPLGNI